ncbi:MAG TPA: hypothetical protein VE093_17975 [Polyangiaceae bacterium]|nr:hypothetical protein [Polyangiaceae bacterium]
MLTLPGVAVVVGSAALVAGGIANVKAGAERLGQALAMSSGSGSSGPQGTPTTGPKPVHGNHLSTTKPAQGYSLRDRDTGEILKYGETTLGRGRYTKKYLDEHNAEMIFEAKGTKAEMHKWQNEKIREHKATNGDRPPLNRSDW